MEIIVNVFSLLFLFLAVCGGRRHTGYALCFILPLLLLVPSYVKFKLGINMNIFNLSVVALFISSLPYIRLNNSINNYLKNILLLFFIFICISTYFLSSYEFPMSDYIQNMILFSFEYFLLPFCLVYVRIPDNIVKYINLGVVISSLVIIIYGIVNYVVKFNVYALAISLMSDTLDMANSFMEETRGFIEGRVSSTFLHPLHLGQAALMLFAYCFSILKGRINNILLFSLLLGLAVMVFLSGSRSAFIPLLIFLAFQLKNISLNNVFVMLLVVILFIIVIVPYLPDGLKNTIMAFVFFWDDTVSNMADISGSSSNMRFQQYEDALKIISSNPIFGNGEGYVRLYGFKHPSMLGYESVILRGLVDWGIMGLLLFFVLFLSFVILPYKILTSRTNRVNIMAFSIAYFVSIVLTGIPYSFFGLFTIIYFVLLNNSLNQEYLISEKL